MNWNISGDLPIYLQLARTIKLAIVSGELESGSRIASVRDLALEAGVNPNTMQKALAHLEQEQLLYSNRTSGRLVTEDKNLISAVRRQFAQNNIKLFLESMGLLGYDTEKLQNMIINIIEEE